MLRTLSGTRRQWTEIIVISVVAYLLYRMNAFMLFLVPVQLLHLRHGDRALSFGALFAMLAVTATAVSRLRLIDDPSLRNIFLMFEIAIPGALIGGLVASNVSWTIHGFRVPKTARLAITTAAVGVLSIPLLLSRTGTQEISNLFVQQIELLRRSYEASAGMYSTGLDGLTALLSDPARLAKLAVELLLRSYLLSYCLIVAGSIWVGDFAAAKTIGVKHRRISDFRLPTRAVWGFLAGWALVLIDTAAGIGAVGYIAWNAALIMLVAYGIQGVAILRHWLVSRGVSMVMRVALGIGLIALLFWPGANVLIIILVPGLGVSETWIHYRKMSKE